MRYLCLAVVLAVIADGSGCVFSDPSLKGTPEVGRVSRATPAPAVERARAASVARQPEVAPVQTPTAVVPAKSPPAKVCYLTCSIGPLPNHLPSGGILVTFRSANSELGQLMFPATEQDAKSGEQFVVDLAGMGPAFRITPGCELTGRAGLTRFGVVFLSHSVSIEKFGEDAVVYAITSLAPDKPIRIQVKLLVAKSS